MRLVLPAVLIVVARVFAIVIGGYFATAGLASLATVLLHRYFAMARADAVTVSTTMAFLVYLGFILWAAAERSLLRAVLVPVAVAAFSFAAAIALAD